MRTILKTTNLISALSYFKKYTTLRAICTTLISIILISAGNAQVNTTFRPAVPDSIIEQRLVELALNGPEMKASAHQGKVYEYQLKTAKNAWMNLLSFSLNYNDQTLKQPPAGATYVYPKYFFGLTVPLGTILSRTPVKAANEAVEIGRLEQERLKRKIKADVLTRYKEYKAQTELIAMETGMMNDVEAALIEARDKFRKNEMSFEAYNLVQRSRNDEYAKILNLKLQQDAIKLEIERMIGTSLESVLR